MRKLQISKTKDYFTDERGDAVFLLADTIWFAFSHMTISEWDYYLDYRQTQGFNALQLGILPITNDASDSALDISPFHPKNAEGHYDFYRMNDVYFDRAEQMVRMAAERGFTCSMIVLHHNYVAEDWGAMMSPWTVMPYDCVVPYVEHVTRRFGKYNPTFIVSGDSGLPTLTAKSYYLLAFETIKAVNPDVLTTMHTWAEIDLLPDEFLYNDHLDYYIYQASHFAERQDRTYRCAQTYYQAPVKRPIISAEVCYEGHGHADRYGRFNEFDVRKAMWWSILAGAKAGITYGAHGMWGLHKKGSGFNNERFSSIPFEWQTALRFQGAWDAGFVKWIFEQYQLFDIEPVNEVLNPDEMRRNEIRMSASPDGAKVVLYMPYSARVIVGRDLSQYKLTLINLTEKWFANPTIATSEDGTSVVEMPQFNSDFLLIGMRK
jgi:hypothetical protein